jgi:hypothetical protein
MKSKFLLILKDILYIHVIPWYSGDMTDPKGGVRGVILEKQKY